MVAPALMFRVTVTAVRHRAMTWSGCQWYPGRDPHAGILLVHI